ncbi:TonB-dependent receptor plug domain-containing protein [Sphingosinicella microcystinivorans]|uniref:TonB-dependent receptor plug domain-containing protein n=1 Tax=Sphingosinicella microcystinivorans TaxID=335406 RepID=UPI0022F3FC8C|nr:TonB-dependent receptor [Sphingosinicella microcystinivorans]WBX86171.1 TonB-dependent receptor [Sphingosinicella microcystinivorans]
MRLVAGLLISTAVAAATAAQAEAADSGSEAEAAAAFDAADAADAAAETIIVTGTRGSRPRTVADSPVPIDVITSEQLINTGRTGLKDILGNIIPSLTMPALGGGGTSSSAKPISIRGLSGDYVLVLVNGKRRHTTSLINNLSRISGGSTPVDIDLIPANAIGRLEVLRDGAAAQYGSDAISGVINFILDSNPEGGEFTTTAGSHYEKGGELFQQALSYGTRLGGDGGFVRFAVEAKYHDRADSSAAYVPHTVNLYPLLADGSRDPREYTIDRVRAGNYGRTNRDYIVNSSYNAELPLSDVTTLYSFSTLSYRDVKDGRGQFNANNVNSLPELYPNGFLAKRRIWETDFQATAGVRSVLWGLDVDFSSSFGKDHVKLGAIDTLNPSLGPSSKTSFFMGKQKSSLWVNNLDFSRPVEIGLAEPITLSFGLEHRWERFQNVAGEPDSYRDGGYIIPTGTTPFELAFGGQRPQASLVSFTGTTPADAFVLTRNNFAGYVDIEANLTKDWFVGLAGRAEHYTDSAGDTVSGKVSTRYEIVPGLAIRGGVNTGFRAPSLAQQGFSTSQNTSIIIDGDRVPQLVKFLAPNDPIAGFLGAKPLKPEKSLNFTAGLTFESGPFRFTVDGYQIDIDDRIVKTEVLNSAEARAILTSPEVVAILAARGVPGISSGQFFINGVDTRTRGVDLVGEYTLQTGALGTFRFNAAYSYNKTKILSVAENPANLSNTILFGRQARADLVKATPRDKLVLNTDWTIGAFRSALRITRFGKYTETSASQTSTVDDRTFGAKWIADIDVAADVGKNLTVAVGANNLFDVYPDAIGVVQANTGAGQYGNFAPFGLSGGFYYGRVSVRF